MSSFFDYSVEGYTLSCYNLFFAVILIEEDECWPTDSSGEKEEVDYHYALTILSELMLSRTPCLDFDPLLKQGKLIGELSEQ